MESKSRTNKLNNSLIENSSLNTLTLSAKNNTINTYYDNNDQVSMFDNSKKKRTKKSQNQKDINNNDYKRMKQKSKMNSDKNIIYRNNLSYFNYAKSLNFMINNHVQAVNTQFKNYNRFRYSNKCNNGNNTFNIVDNKKNKYYINRSMNEEKKEKENSDNDSSKKLILNNSLKFIRNKKSKNKNNNNRYNNFGEFKTYEKNKKIILIQTFFRGYFVRYKLYNTLLLFTTLKKIFLILKNKFIYYKKYFFNELIIKSKYINDNNNEIEQKNISDNNINIIYNLRNKDKIYTIYNINNIDIYKKSKSTTNINTIDNSNSNNYSICEINNINICNKNEKNNLFIEEKKIYEKQIKELKDENKYIKEKNKEYQKNEDKYNHLKEENEKLNNINNDIIKEKEQLLLELKKAKEEYEKLLKEKNQSEIGINYINNNNINIIKPPKNKKLEREKYLINLFRVKVFEKRKNYLIKCFARFYYNGIFLQLTGKLKHLNQNQENNDNNEDFDFSKLKSTESIQGNIEPYNQNEAYNKSKSHEKMTKKNTSLNIKRSPDEVLFFKENEKINRAKSDLKERIKKSRGLRKLMNKKATEKQEKLRYYFFKFYRAGILREFKKKSQMRRRSCQLNAPINLNMIESIIEKKEKKSKDDDALKEKEKKEKEELKLKLIKLLQKIIFKTDRRNMIVINRVFKKYYLKAKIESLHDIIETTKSQRKKKKKVKKKVNFVGNLIEDKKDN